MCSYSLQIKEIDFYWHEQTFRFYMIMFRCGCLHSHFVLGLCVHCVRGCTMIYQNVIAFENVP